MGAGTEWICSLCKTWFNRKDEEPKHTTSEGKWICEKCHSKGK